MMREFCRGSVSPRDCRVECVRGRASSLFKNFLRAFCRALVLAFRRWRSAASWGREVALPSRARSPLQAPPPSPPAPPAVLAPPAGNPKGRCAPRATTRDAPWPMAARVRQKYSPRRNLKAPSLWWSSLMCLNQRSVRRWAMMKRRRRNSPCILPEVDMTQGRRHRLHLSTESRCLALAIPINLGARSGLEEPRRVGRTQRPVDWEPDIDL